MLKLSDFDYSLPAELIAQYPLKQRDAAKLLVLNRQKQTIEHRVFKDILDYLNKNDLVVLNDTKVLPCQLIGRRPTGGRVEVLLLNRKNGFKFNAMIKPSRVKLGEEIIFNGKETLGVVTAKDEITFNVENQADIYNLGSMPLPPYIKRDTEELDKIYYQTVYAREEGAIASPTAGLHFTQELIKEMETKGIKIANITLHVGVGTFKPVKSDDIEQHKMEPECFKIPQNAIEAIKEAKKENARIFAVGTTSLRVLETYSKGMAEGSTDLFIYPGFEFKLADCLLTNFHLPKTTLFMLVCAFAGEALAKKAYQQAIDNKYRFYSYGDAMLIV